MRIYILITLLFLSHAAAAQPGDREFSILTFDSYGFVGCSHGNFKFYACSVNYPNSLRHSDSLELVWKPDLKTIKILEALRCVAVKSDSLNLPYQASFHGSSCLNTNILMIIRNEKDTMLISTAGADPYALVVSPNGQDLGLPFIFPFQRGLFYLQKLASDKSTSVLFNSTHRDYYFAYYNSSTAIISRAGDARISYQKMNKLRYHANDTLAITLTGRILNDGGCGGGGILWTLQKFENNKWMLAEDNCCTQMDCGIGPTIANQSLIPVFIRTEKINKEMMTYPIQKEFASGKYRLVVYDDYFLPYWTEEFVFE